MSHFKRDKVHEEIIAGWLDKYFYSKLNIYEVAHKRVEEVKAESRIKDAQEQGIDIVLKDKNEEKFYVDEKSQTTYLNDPRPTFAFEISYERDGVLKTGWLVDEKKNTNHYLLVYPMSETILTYKELQTFEDIDSAEILFINKEKLMSELYNLGITEELLVEKAANIEHEKENNHLQIDEISKKFVTLYKSGHLNENPVNIIIRRTILDKIASGIWKVKKDSVEEVKSFNQYWIRDK